MKLKKYQFYLILFIGLPIWFLGWGVFIWDYFLPKISEDIAKDILGLLFTVFIWFWPLRKWGDEIVDFK